MKTKLIIFAAVLLATTGIAFAAIHHYGFILSCGKEAYYWADHELSSTEKSLINLKMSTAPRKQSITTSLSWKMPIAHNTLP